MLQLVTPHTTKSLTSNFEVSQERKSWATARHTFFTGKESRERTEVNDCHYRRGVRESSRSLSPSRRPSFIGDGRDGGRRSEESEERAAWREGGTRDPTRALTHTHYYRPSTGERRREKEGGDSRGDRTPKIFLRKTISLASFGKKGSQKIRGHHAQLLHMMQSRPAPDSTSFPTLASNRRIGTNLQPQRVQSRLGAATNRFTVPQIPDKLCNNNRRGPTPPPPWQDLGWEPRAVKYTIKGQRRKLHAWQHPQTKMEKEEEDSKECAPHGKARGKWWPLFRKHERRNQFETFS